MTEEKFKNLSIALGFFDGVHKAHQDVILNAVNFARQKQVSSAVVTFNTHPAELLGKEVKYITSVDTRNRLIKSLGIDYIFCLDNNKEILNTDYKDYLKILYERFTPSAVTAGFNHTFGKARLGTSDVLEKYKDKYSYRYFKIQPQMYKNKIISSTLIRSLLSAGDIVSANLALGHDFEFSGTVIKGRQLGRVIGFPTANLIYPDKIVQIPYGVYSVEAEVKNKLYKGMMNFGLRPTVEHSNTSPAAEVHILNFSGDIYGEKIIIKVKKQIRAEHKFDSIELLQLQIAEDIKQC